jgi:hypothetical protein
VPISQLVEYFNDRIRAEKVCYLPEDPIRIRKGEVFSERIPSAGRDVVRDAPCRRS